MDLTLSLSYQEQNDNKAIVLTDTTTNWNDSTNGTTRVAGESTVVGVMYQIVLDIGATDFTTVGAANNVTGTRFVANAIIVILAGDSLLEVTPDFDEITAITLNTNITGVDGIETSKSQVDLYTLNSGPFTLLSELEYTITAALLGDEADSELIDGLYELTYNIIATIAGGEEYIQELNVTILVYGVVKVATYEKLRTISTLYVCKDGAVADEISEADLCGAYLSSIENSAYIAKTEELINMLIVLDNIVKNGSNITW